MKFFKALVFALLFSFVASAGAPPAVVALPYYNEKTGNFSLNYNGRAIVTLELPPGTPLKFRGNTDGALVSTPLTQQLYFLCPENPVQGKMKFFLKKEALCMRPRRAKDDEAILGQVGSPLIYGVNGIYSVDEDLLIYWTNENWHWSNATLVPDENGNLTAELEVTLTEVPWIFNLRMRYYSEHLGYRYFAPWETRPKQKPVAGWCSWLAYHTNITEERIKEAANFLAEKFVPYGLEYLQIDDGYQNPNFGITEEKTLSESWLAPTENFPKGVTNVVSSIKAKGLLPAVWMNTDIRTYEPRPNALDVILRKKDGTPWRVPWLRFVNSLTDEALQETLAPLWENFSKAGFAYIKIDSLRHAYYDGLGSAVRAGEMTTEEARARFRRLFEVARAKAGNEVFLLSCWGLYTESIGKVDACRISTDTNPSLERLFLQQYEMARYWPLQRLLFQLDPDHVCARAQRNWARATLSNVSLGGGLLMISDPINAYKEDLIEDIRRVLPPLPTLPAETAPVDQSEPTYANYANTYKTDEKNPYNEKTSGYFENKKFATLWAHHLVKGESIWSVILRSAIFNLSEEEIKLENLGLDPTKTYLVFDFWKKEFLGEVKAKINFPKLEAGDFQTLIVREAKNHPQFLATSRHLAGGFVEGVSEKFEEDGSLLLEILPQPEDLTVYLAVPSGWVLNDKIENALTEGKLLALPFRKSEQKNNKTLKLRFTKH